MQRLVLKIFSDIIHCGCVLQPFWHAAIQAVHSQLQEGESLYAYLDDVYAMVEPHRVKPVYDLLAHHLYNHAHIQLNSGKTRVWNLAGVPPPNLEPLGADVWVGNPALPPEQLTVLGAPLGTPEYQRHHLSQTRASHQALLDEIPSLDDLQASWLLLLYCASPRCNYLLRMLPPTTTRQYAHDHDLAVLSCLTTLLDAANMPATAVALAHLPLHLGGLGLTSATITAAPAYWASWADTLPILYRQAPQQATTLLQQLEAETSATPSIQALTQAMDQLQRHGFEPPSWADLVQGSAPPTQPDPEQRLLGRGWQRPAALASHQAFRAHSKPRPSQPGHAPIAVRPICQQNFHHHPLWIRHHLSLSPLPCPTPPTPTSPTASVSPHLSVPSHFRPIRRPSRSMCPGRGFTGTRDSFGKGSSQSLPGSWGQGNHQHPPQRSTPEQRSRTHANPRSAHTQNFSVPEGAGSWSSPSKQGAGGAQKRQLSSASWPTQKPEQFPTSFAKLLRLPSSHAGQPSSPMQPNMLSRPVSWT